MEATHEAVPHTVERAIEKLNNLNLTGLYDVHGDSVSAALNAQLRDCLDCLRSVANAQTADNTSASVLYRVAELATAEAGTWPAFRIQTKRGVDFVAIEEAVPVSRSSHLSTGKLMITEAAVLNDGKVRFEVWHSRPATKEELTAYLSEQS